LIWLSGPPDTWRFIQSHESDEPSSTASADEQGAKKVHGSKLLDRATAVHEAGHAVARVLTAEDMAWQPEEAIDDIETGDEYAGILDGQKLVGAAICRGPMFTSEIERHHPVTPTSGLNDFNDHCMQVVAKSRAAGVDILKWLQATALIDVFGPAAHARLLDAPILEVWERLSSADDRDSLLFKGRLAGLDDEAIDTCP
jgi:hypothetical protein